ncbi:hypothetical protein LAZ67_5004297 [Cordylochernes scorpioides]|uniref:Uncharacterized protein n=1 Tax=Cordylochernes scorpioides TaxID=51811 RepID=A0ABY6KKU9_9ARAC|nr:hypothetical protein LAZ67_5004297 [Cordylochernes scorpioides]
MAMGRQMSTGIHGSQGELNTTNSPTTTTIRFNINRYNIRIFEIRTLQDVSPYYSGSLDQIRLGIPIEIYQYLNVHPNPKKHPTRTTTTTQQKHYNPFPDVQKARQPTFSRTQLKHERDKQRYDKGHQAPHFEIGDLVLVKKYKHPDTGKLALYFTGPFTIIEIISPNVVRINRSNRPLNKEDDTVHVNKLKYYTENILFLPHTPLIQTPRVTPDVHLVEFKHLCPTIFDAQKFRPIPPTCSAPFLHLTAELSSQGAPGLIKHPSRPPELANKIRGEMERDVHSFCHDPSPPIKSNIIPVRAGRFYRGNQSFPARNLLVHSFLTFRRFLVESLFFISPLAQLCRLPPRLHGRVDIEVRLASVVAQGASNQGSQVWGQRGKERQQLEADSVVFAVTTNDRGDLQRALSIFSKGSSKRPGKEKEAAVIDKEQEKPRGNLRFSPLLEILQALGRPA